MTSGGLQLSRLRGRHCLDFDFEYSVKFEAKLTPFEAVPSQRIGRADSAPA